MAKQRTLKQAIVSTMLAMLITALPVQAAQTAENAVWLQLAERALSLQEAAGKAQRQFGGKVIKADPVHLQGRSAYRIRMVRPDGRVKEVMLDAASGQPLRRKRK